MGPRTGQSGPHTRRYPRRRRLIRLGAAVCLVTIACFTLSFGWHIGWALKSGDFIQLDEGHLVIGRTYCSPGMTLTGPTPITFGAMVSNLWETQRFTWSPPSRDGRWHAQIPLWSILLAAAIPTLLLWLGPRFRKKPGHCLCGYDLVGNTTGVCPECGRPFIRVAAQEHPAAN
jgi:hypothetical protein